MSAWETKDLLSSVGISIANQTRLLCTTANRNQLDIICPCLLLVETAMGVAPIAISFIKDT